MSARAVLGALLAGGVIGYAVASPVPDVEYIRGERLPPKILTEKEVIVEEVMAPFPSECQASIKATRVLVNKLNNWNNMAAEFYDELDAVDYAMIEDQSANNDLVIRVNTILKREENTLYEIFSTQHHIESSKKACEDALESTP